MFMYTTGNTMKLEEIKIVQSKRLNFNKILQLRYYTDLKKIVQYFRQYNKYTVDSNSNTTKKRHIMMK